MIRLSVKVTIFIYFLTRFCRSDSDLSSVYFIIFMFCHLTIPAFLYRFSISLLYIFLILFFRFEFITRITAESGSVVRCSPVCIKVNLIQESCIE